MSNFSFTKEDIQTIVTLWQTKRPQEICEIVGINKKQLDYIVKIIRDTGYPLQKKRVNGQVNSLVRLALE